MNATARPPASHLRKRLLAGEPLLGTFIKTPSIHATAQMRAAVQRITAPGVAGKPLCAHVGDIAADETRWLREQGVCAFIVASDQGFLRRAAARILSDFRGSR